MAVRQGDRSQGKLQVIDKAKDMIRYTYARVVDSTFPKSERWLLAKSIWDEVYQAHTKIVRANAMHIDSADEAKERLLLQKEAISHLDELCFLIDTAHILGKIDDGRAVHWVGLVIETQNLAKGWHKKDRKTAKDLHGISVE